MLPSQRVRQVQRRLAEATGLEHGQQDLELHEVGAAHVDQQGSYTQALELPEPHDATGRAVQRQVQADDRASGPQLRPLDVGPWEVGPRTPGVAQHGHPEGLQQGREPLSVGPGARDADRSAPQAAAGPRAPAALAAARIEGGDAAQRGQHQGQRELRGRVRVGGPHGADHHAPVPAEPEVDGLLVVHHQQIQVRVLLQHLRLHRPVQRHEGADPARLLAREAEVEQAEVLEDLGHPGAIDAQIPEEPDQLRLRAP